MDIKLLKSKVKAAENKVAEVTGSLQENESQLKAIKEEIDSSGLPSDIVTKSKEYIDAILSNEGTSSDEATLMENPLKAFIEENEEKTREYASQIINLLS